MKTDNHVMSTNRTSSVAQKETERPFNTTLIKFSLLVKFKMADSKGRTRQKVET